MKEFLQELYRYNAEVNARIFDGIIRDLELVTPRVRELASHILLVHQSWNERMMGRSTTRSLWEILPSEQWFSLNEKNSVSSLEIIEKSNFEDVFSYTNTKGDVFSGKFQDVLVHVVNHSSYHRGQINADLRREGSEPVNTDYIFYKREMEMKQGSRPKA